jgi:hypothetical protein
MALPSKIVKILVQEWKNLPLGLAFLLMVGMFLGAFIGIDLFKRLILLLPVSFYPFLLPLFVTWLIVLLLGIDAYRQKEYVTFGVMLLPILLPILPPLIIFLSVSITLPLLGSVLVGREKVEEPFQGEGYVVGNDV